tara:strand:- start:44 stop:388 length:345 start_codon:yes stop_codon:yes gene_type:complete
MGVTSDPVIKHFDVVEHIRLSQVTGFVDPFANAFLFQAAEEGFRHRVIPAISPTAHARFEVMGAAESMPVIAAVLRALDALLRVKQQFSTGQSHVAGGVKDRTALALCNVLDNG